MQTECHRNHGQVFVLHFIYKCYGSKVTDSSIVYAFGKDVYKRR